MAKAKKVTTPKISKKQAERHAEDELRLGPQVAAVKRQTNPKAWAKFVKSAHKRGVTVSGALSGQPPALQERTRSSLLSEAKKTVSTSYEPAAKVLDEQQRRVGALDAKRKEDDDYYKNWLVAKQETFNAQARSAQTRLDGIQREIADTTKQGGIDMQTAAQETAQAAPGTVSDMAQSKAIGALSADAKAANDRVANTRAATAAMGPSIELGLQTLNTSALANAAARRAKGDAETQKATTAILDERVKLAAAQASDGVKEFTRLLDGEVSKAASNRDFGAAAEKLGLEGQKLNAKVLQDAKTYDLKVASAADKRASDAAKLKLGYDALVSKEGQAAADRALRAQLAADKAAGGAGKPKKTTASERRLSGSGIKTVTSALPILKRLLATPKGTGEGQRSRTVKEIMIEKGFSGVMIDIAADLNHNKGKLSKAGRQKARSIGIIIPPDWQ